MKKQRFVYHLSGYKYAPESFRVSKKCGNQHCKILLSNEDRRNMGYIFITHGIDAAVDFVKRIERKERQECKMYLTYGFLTVEEPMTFVYCNQIYCRYDASLKERFAIYMQFKNDMVKKNGKVIRHTECSLDGNFKPVDVKEKYLTADFNKPVAIPLAA